MATRRKRRIPIPRDVMQEFKRMADGSKAALRNYLQGYRRAFRQRVAAGETPAQISRSVMRNRRLYGTSKPSRKRRR
jgi:hypothetical protein